MRKGDLFKSSIFDNDSMSGILEIQEKKIEKIQQGKRYLRIILEGGLDVFIWAEDDIDNILICRVGESGEMFFIG